MKRDLRRAVWLLLAAVAPAAGCATPPTPRAAVPDEPATEKTAQRVPPASMREPAAAPPLVAADPEPPAAPEPPVASQTPVAPEPPAPGGMPDVAYVAEDLQDLAAASWIEIARDEAAATADRIAAIEALEQLLPRRDVGRAMLAIAESSGNSDVASQACRMIESGLVYDPPEGIGRDRQPGRPRLHGFSPDPRVGARTARLRDSRACRPSAARARDRSRAPRRVGVPVPRRRGGGRPRAGRADAPMTRARTGHVYRDGRLVVKWDLDRGEAMEGAAPARIRKLLAELVDEGLL